MQIHTLNSEEWTKAVAIGVAVSILTGLITFVGLKAGISPLPKPLGLAFAETLWGSALPLPVGLLFHAVWVTGFSVVYFLLFADALTFMRAFWLAFVLWIATLVFFFPVVGWGFLGLAVTPKVIVAAAVLHLLFAVFLWGLARMTLGARIEGLPARA